MPTMSCNTSPNSCDTFVVVNGTEDGGVIFGKNSDRPEEEVQDIVYNQRQSHSMGEMVKCTYIAIEQTSETHANILSKPNWMWGAEMGANEYGVCIGNEAVSTKLQSDEDAEKKLLGMDLVRLGLERGKTALEALNTITALLEKHGQGGPCSNTVEDFTYHNAFIICDRKEAYVLETAKKIWAAEKVVGYRNISNCLSIGTKIDLMSDGLKEKAKELGFWNGSGEFNFTEAFSTMCTDDCQRFGNGSKLLKELTSKPAKFTAKNMMNILRNEESGICMREGMFLSTSSQVSVLSQPGSKRPDVHWFTGTPDPILSVFKPFVFTTNSSIGSLLVSPNENTPHRLYALHKTALERKPKVFEQLAEIEGKCYGELAEFLANIEEGKATITELDLLFQDCAETEEKFYK